LVPDVPSDTITPEQDRIAQLLIRKRCEVVRRNRSENKDRKYNHFPSQPVNFEPVSLGDMSLNLRDRFE
jgi:hypothetical protein